jgi:integrase
MQKETKFPYTVRFEGVSAKIYYQKRERGGGEYENFIVSYFCNGKRKLKSFADFAEAKRYTKDALLAVARDRASVASLTGADVQSYIAARRLLEPLGIPLHEAIEQFVAKRSREHPLPDKRVSELVAECLEEKKAGGLSKRYLETLQYHLSRFAAAFGKTVIASITTGALQEWLAHEYRGLRTRNNVRSSVVTLFHFARARGHLPKHQTTEADDVPRAKDNGGAIEIFAPKEMSRLMATATAEGRLYFALAGFAGIRRAEIERLEWRDFNFARRAIEIGKHKAKTRSRRLVPISANLLEWLRPFYGRTGRLFARRRIVEDAIANAKRKGGLEWKQNALRHSFASYRMALIGNEARVANEMGTSAQKLHSNYRELAHKSEAKAWFAIAPKPSQKVVPMRAAAA